MLEQTSNSAITAPPAVAAARPYSVTTLGFESPERRALRGVLGLSEQGEPIFRPFVEAPDKTPDIVIVNADDPDALRLGLSLKRTDRFRKVVPVFVSHAREVQGARYVLSRPILPAELLSLLEQVVVEKRGFVPAGEAGVRQRLVVLSERERTAAIVAAAPVIGSPAVPVVSSSTPIAPPAAAPLPALVIDASLPLRALMRDAMAPLVSQLDFAGSGAQALRQIESQHYSLIFVDADLPGQDAYDICRYIRKHPLQQSTSVVLLTSRSRPADPVKEKEAGYDSHLIKPVHESALLQIVAQLKDTTDERLPH